VPYFWFFNFYLLAMYVLGVFPTSHYICYVIGSVFAIPPFDFLHWLYPNMPRKKAERIAKISLAIGMLFILVPIVITITNN